MLAQASVEDTEWTPTTTQVQDVQRRLTALGFKPGTPDGRIGPRTVAAIQEYQRSINVNVDGQLTEDLYQRLIAQPAPATNSPQSPSFAEPAKPEGSVEVQKSADCPPASGKWLFEDQQGGSFELSLVANGEITGPFYSQHWHWESDDLAIKILYDNGMGLTVTRNGQMDQEDVMIGDAKDSRGRSWTWTAKRLPNQADCPASTTQ